MTTRPLWLASDPCQLQGCTPPVGLEEDADVKYADLRAAAPKRAASVAESSVDTDAVAKFFFAVIEMAEKGLVSLGYEDAGSVGEDLAEVGVSDAEPDSQQE